jgi:thiol:disulfide interchange protein/DsbC/DsbD-like thiol-disulfide interchange protein
MLGMRTPRRNTVALLLAAFLLPSGASAVTRHVQATLVSELESIRPGVPLTVAIRLQMDEGWHTYWKNPADSGLPTRMSWRLPEGLTAGELQWPRPERLAAPPLVSYGYEGDVLLPVEITVAPTLKAGTQVELAGRVDWLECREACIPGKADLALVLPVRAETPRPSALATRFAETRARVPMPSGDWKVEARSSGDALVLSFDRAGAVAREAYFFASEPQVLEYAAPQALRRSGSTNVLHLARDPNGPKDLKRLRGVLVTDVSGRTVALEVDAPVVAGARAFAGDERRVEAGLPLALALAFLGGLVLNLMPCVLPVLSLKVLAFVKQAGEERRTWRHGVAFTAGVLVSFWALAGLLLALRAAGEQVGWGFQLQSPAFVVFLAALFCLLALNLFGVFEVGTSLIAAGNLTARRSGLAASFGSGALATIVATPCTAPFMGSALGFGLSQPPAVSLLVFTSLALGMAAPYLLLSFHPGWLRFVPRPGAWMESFKQLMGFFLMATVAALVWLFGRQVGVDGMAALLAALVAVSLGAWVYGRAAAWECPRRRLAGSVAAVALVTLGLVAGLSRAGASAAAAEGGDWEPWSAERVAELRAGGRPVFVDFTADWCLTCQVNERVALRDSDVQARLRERGVVPMRADWTRHDPRITEALAAHGREGVPLYVLYDGPADAPPIVLPEVITPGIVLDALDREPGPRAPSPSEEKTR